MHLRTAYMGLEDMQNHPKRFYTGLMNAITFSRSVTFALQNMQKEVVGFDEWYAPRQEAMKKDLTILRRSQEHIFKSGDRPGLSEWDSYVILR